MLDIFNKKKAQPGNLIKPYYSFRSVHANKVLDIAQEGENKGTATIDKGYAGDHQSFAIEQVGQQFYIKMKTVGTYLTVQNQENGCKLYMAPKSGHQNQKFKRRQVVLGSRNFLIITYCGKALDVLEQKKKSGSRVSQYTINEGKNQLWNFCDPKEITSSSQKND